jgi:hypothetical protein
MRVHNVGADRAASWYIPGNSAFAWSAVGSPLRLASISLSNFSDHLLVTAVPGERLFECEQVLRTIISLQRLRDLLLAALHTAMTQLCEVHRIANSFQDRINKALTTDTSDIAQHVMDL